MINLDGSENDMSKSEIEKETHELKKVDEYVTLAELAVPEIWSAPNLTDEFKPCKLSNENGELSVNFGNGEMIGWNVKTRITSTDLALLNDKLSDSFLQQNFETFSVMDYKNFNKSLKKMTLTQKSIGYRVQDGNLGKAGFARGDIDEGCVPFSCVCSVKPINQVQNSVYAIGIPLDHEFALVLDADNNKMAAGLLMQHAPALTAIAQAKEMKDYDSKVYFKVTAPNVSLSEIATANTQLKIHIVRDANKKIVRLQAALYFLKPVKKGDIICWNYGAQALKQVQLFYKKGFSLEFSKYENAYSVCICPAKRANHVFPWFQQQIDEICADKFYFVRLQYLSEKALVCFTSQHLQQAMQQKEKASYRVTIKHDRLVVYNNEKLLHNVLLGAVKKILSAQTIVGCTWTFAHNSSALTLKADDVSSNEIVYESLALLEKAGFKSIEKSMFGDNAAITIATAEIYDDYILELNKKLVSVAKPESELGVSSQTQVFASLRSFTITNTQAGCAANSPPEASESMNLMSTSTAPAAPH